MHVELGNALASVGDIDAAIAEYMGRDPRRKYVDVTSAMLGTDGLPKPEIFLKDRLTGTLESCSRGLGGEISAATFAAGAMGAASGGLATGAGTAGVALGGGVAVSGWAGAPAGCGVAPMSCGCA